MNIRNRVKELRSVPASELLANPKNWRTHPDAQRNALRGILDEIGYAGALLARELEDGSLMLVDGHLRAETTPDQDVPVLVLDITESEADKLLLSLDPLSSLAESNAKALEDLLNEAHTSDPALAAMWEQLASDNGLLDGGKMSVEQMEVKSPPQMAWVLIGIPVVRYGQIQEHLDSVVAVEGVTFLSTANDQTHED